MATACDGNTKFSLLRTETDTSQLSADCKISMIPLLLAELVDISAFDNDCLLRFSITVYKNYRPMPYHNYDHAFSVVHCCYAIMKASPEMFTPIEVIYRHMIRSVWCTCFILT